MNAAVRIGYVLHKAVSSRNILLNEMETLRRVRPGNQRQASQRSPESSTTHAGTMTASNGGNNRDYCHDRPAPQPPKRLGRGEHCRNRRPLARLT